MESEGLEHRKNEEGCGGCIRVNMWISWEDGARRGRKGAITKTTSLCPRMGRMSSIHPSVMKRRVLILHILSPISAVRSCERTNTITINIQTKYVRLIHHKSHLRALVRPRSGNDMICCVLCECVGKTQIEKKRMHQWGCLTLKKKACNWEGGSGGGRGEERCDTAHRDESSRVEERKEWSEQRERGGSWNRGWCGWMTVTIVGRKKKRGFVEE